MVALLVVMTIIVFLTVDFFVQRAELRRAPEVADVAAPASAQNLNVMIPSGMYLDKGHTWVSREDSGNLRLGLSSLPVMALGSPENIWLLPGGTLVRKGAPILKLRRGEEEITLRAPVNGTIESVNSKALEDPSRLVRNSFDPSNWFYRLKPEGAFGGEEGMLSGEEAQGWLQREFARLRDFFSKYVGDTAMAGATLADGGLPIEGFAERLGKEEWTRFVNDFIEHNN